MPSDGSSLCATARVVASVLDGASERAVLIDEDGTVLHMNGAADHFLHKTSSPHATDFLACEDWRSVEHCCIVMAGGKTTRSERNIHWVKHEPCPCCQRQYFTAYICSKHERVREVVDHAFDPVVTIDDKGIICTANEAVMELFGYPEGELVGHNLRMLCGGGHAENHDLYIQNYLESGVKKVIGKKREVMAKKKCGTEFPCELGVQEIKDVSTGKRFFCGFFKDLTLLKQHEAELQERQDLMQGMINSATECMVEIDEAGIIKIVNNAALSMFGYTRSEFLGSNISMICGDGHAEHHSAYMRRYMDGGEKRIIGRKRQVKARRKDGSEFECDLSVQEVFLSSGRRAFCGFIRDLTAQKKDKRALRRQQQMISGKFFGTEGVEE